MDALRLCREQTAESGFEPGSEDRVEGPNHQAGLPSTHHAESLRCHSLRSASVKDRWGRDDADGGPGHRGR